MTAHKTPRPNRISERWGLPPATPFLALPRKALEVVWQAGASPYAERVLLALLADWNWQNGPSAPVSAASIAKALGTQDRRAVRRALQELALKGLIHFLPGSNGKLSEASLRPLIAKTRGGQTLAGEGGKDSQVGGQRLTGNLRVPAPLTCEVSGSGMQTKMFKKNKKERSGTASPCAVEPRSAAPKKVEPHRDADDLELAELLAAHAAGRARSGLA